MTSSAEPHVASKALQRLTQLSGEAQTSDFTIQCGQRKWEVHRIILAMHSEVLQKSCYGEFKEAKERILDLSAEEECVITALVHFLYHFDYEYLSSGIDPAPLTFHVKIFLLANMYDISPLQDLAASKFDASLKAGTQAIDLLSAAIAVYECRTISKDLCVHLVHHLARDKDTTLCSDGSFHKLAEEVPALFVDLARVLSTAGCEHTTFKCSKCGYSLSLSDKDTDTTVFCHYCGSKKPEEALYASRKISKEKGVPSLDSSQRWRV